MDKFSFWTLKVLSYVFLFSAVASILLWILEDKSYSNQGTSWMVWLASVLTSLFFAATSHVLARVIERIFATNDEFESSYQED